MSPALALAIFAVLVLGAVLVFWPDRGGLARLMRNRRSRGRVLLEDALKHVYTLQAVGRPGSAEAVAEHLGVSDGRAEALLERLRESGLVHTGEDGARLTGAGRESALHLVRAHRLWERYLADRTGVPAGEWHEEAERMEHALTPDDADTLASRLGHPRWDPHGDAIPTAGGELPDSRGGPLTEIEPGRTVEVVHLEDEPREIYEALLDDGIELGARLDVIDAGADSVRVRVRGNEWSIESDVARNVTVRALPEGVSADGPIATLLDLAPGEVGRVTAISPACRGTQRRRLLDLGVVKGTLVEAELRSASGDPIAYRIRGALIALRREQAVWVRIEQVPADAGFAATTDAPAPAMEA